MISKKTFIQTLNSRALCVRRQIIKIINILAKRGPRIRINKDKETADFTYLTISNRKSFPMIEVSLRSFYKNSSLLPKQIIIVSDGSWQLDEGRSYFSRYDINFKFVPWVECAEYCKNELSSNHLFEWAQKHIWGKKMCAILKYSAEGATLFSDPDVLWYNTPFSNEFIQSDNFLKVSLDNSHNYDNLLVEEQSLEYLYDVPPINCGIVLSKGNLLHLSSDKINNAFQKEAKSPGNFAEQTIIALMVHEFGITWREDEISASIDDVLSPLFRVNSYPESLIARHYVWVMTWMYWKDAFYTKTI